MHLKKENRADVQVAVERDSDFAFVAWLCSLSGTICALIFAGARAGLEGSLVFPLLCVAVIWSAAFSPFLVPHRWRGNERGRAAIGMISLMLLAGPVLAYWVAPPVFALYPVFALAGTVRAWRRFRPTPVQVSALVILPPLVAIYLVTTMQYRPGVNLFGPELAKLGWFTTDAYWHATMARLAQVHGVITLGLDGLDFQQRYHPGSHLWFGGLATAAGSTPLFAYPLGYMVIVLPGLLMAGGNFVIGASRGAGAWKRVLILMALVVVLERVSFLNFYISESYGISLLALTLALPLLFVLRAGDGRVAAYLSWLVAVVLAVPLTVIKVSMGPIWAALVEYRAFRLWGLRPPTFLILLLFIAALPYPISISVLEWGRLFDVFRGSGGQTSSAVPIQPFEFFRDQPMFTFSALLPAGMLLLSRLGPGARANPAGGSAAAAARPYVEILLIMAGLGLACTGLYLGGNDSMYFLAPVQWVGLLCIAALPDASWVSRLYQGTGRTQQFFCHGLASACGLLLILIVALKFEFNFNITIGTARSMIAVLKPDDPLGGANDRDFAGAWVHNLFSRKLFDAAFAEALANSPGGRVERIANDLIGKNREGAAAFVTLEQHSAWEKRFELLPPPPARLPTVSPRNCAEPFFVQALTGIPLLQGVPPFWRRCPESVFHFGHDLVWQRLQATDLDDFSICEIARKKKITKVLVLRNVEAPERNRLLVCY